MISQQVSGSGTLVARYAPILVVGSIRLFRRHSRTMGWSFSLAAKAQFLSQSGMKGDMGNAVKLSFLDSQKW